MPTHQPQDPMQCITPCLRHRLAGLLLSALVAALCAPLTAQAQPTGRLNDTGQTLCYDGTNTLVACTAANTGDGAAHPRQDGRFGRDVAGMAKVGGGAAGFDFIKVCWNGDVEGAGTCPSNPTANTGATATGVANDWACTKDNHTNLIWSLQTVSNINWTDATSTVAASPIGTHHSNIRCGFNTGWRVPTRRELLSIVRHGASSSPAIDAHYFPGTAGSPYWSNDSYAPNPAGAWVVDFDVGNTGTNGKTNAHHVRLVRSGQ